MKNYYPMLLKKHLKYLWENEKVHEYTQEEINQLIVDNALTYVVRLKVVIHLFWSG
jgi:hypothetical protein